MGRSKLTHSVALLGLVVAAGCERSSNEAVPLSPSATGSVEMPAGHPPVEGMSKKSEKSITGTVTETMDAGGYTYVQLDTGSDRVWSAVPRAQVKVGDKVTVEQAMPMTKFESPSLGRTFDVIYFGVLQGGAGHSFHNAAGSAAVQPPASALPIPEEIKVEKAKGADARTVEELFANAKDLSGKPVRVRGVVVKVNQKIMGKNWVHLRDGTGSEGKKNHDLVITSQEVPQVGATVVMVGTLATNKDFGSGYAYDVLVEEATFKTEGGE